MPIINESKPSTNAGKNSSREDLKAGEISGDRGGQAGSEEKVADGQDQGESTAGPEGNMVRGNKVNDLGERAEDCILSNHETSGEVAREEAQRGAQEVEEAQEQEPQEDHIIREAKLKSKNIYFVELIVGRERSKRTERN